MNTKTVEEKINPSDKLVDKYLNEIGADAIANTSNIINMSQQVGGDVMALANWVKKKNEARKRKKLLAQQAKQKALKNKNVS